MSQNESPKNSPRETRFGIISSSITAKLILVMVALIILPLAVNWVFYYRSASSDLANQTGRLAREVAENTAEAVAQTLEEQVHLLEALAVSGEIRNLLRRSNQSSGQSPELNAFKDLFPQHLDVFLTDRNGMVLAATSKTSGNYRADEAWWQQAYLNGAGAVFIGKPVRDGSSGTTTLLMTVPVRGSSNELLGMLGSTFDARGIVELLNIVKLNEISRTLVVDPEGVVVFDHAKQLGAEQKLPAPLLRAGLGKSSRSGWVQAKGFEDKDSIVGYAKPLRTSGNAGLDKLQWTTLTVLTVEDAIAPITSSIRWQMLFGVVVVLLAVGAALFLAQQLTAQIKHIGDLFQRMRVGNYKARAKVVSNDELGQMAEELNSLLDDTLKLAQSREERQEMQNAIIKLLDEVSGVADGDLTAVAEVGPDITGAIADAFNHMTAELCRVIGRVQDVTLQVGTSATETQSATEYLAQDSERQAQQILATRGAIEVITASIRQVSEIAGLSKNVAQQSLMTAKNGADAVRNTVKGMNSLREQVQQTSKRIKRLGENSQEIGEIVQLIGGIAYRTSVLALNASIQAARAGEAGRGFAVVAEEVEALAKRSTDATKRIAELVKTIQFGTNEAIAAMEESTREVVEGSNLAEQAGRALIEIESVSTRLADMIQSISIAAEKQAKDSQAISHVMVEISESTQQTVSGMKQSASSVNTLAALANDLRLSVASFKLPSNRENGWGNGRSNGRRHTRG